MSTIPAPDADVWTSAVSLLDAEFAISPLRTVDEVRFCGVGVGNTAVQASATEVHLQVTHTRHGEGKPHTVWELSMPPRFARYLAGLLDSHARYIQSAPERE